MTVTPLKRVFSLNGVKLPDPAPQLSIEQVRGILAHAYPEIATATISGPEPVGDALKYTFERAIGSKG
ncbi:MAG TPA: PRTRC system protein C [Bryobacteraceae bacterium]|nr:PRTRC system protein C [Bryobacteraceae bacterium]